MPTGTFATGFEGFLSAYGHRCGGEGELATPRWSEDPTPVLQAIWAHTTRKAPAQIVVGGPGVEQELLSAVEGKQRQAAQQWLTCLARYLPLQSRALHAYAYVIAGTRRWALAAAHEAMSDKRLANEQVVFFYELEEIKQMMTGEWNISDLDRIRATAEARRSAWETWQSEHPGAVARGRCGSPYDCADLACPRCWKWPRQPGRVIEPGRSSGYGAARLWSLALAARCRRPVGRARITHGPRFCCGGGIWRAWRRRTRASLRRPGGGCSRFGGR